MDKNTITGFILIAAVLIGFSIYSSKEAEKQKNKLITENREIIENRQDVLNNEQSDSLSPDVSILPANDPWGELAKDKNISSDSISATTDSLSSKTDLSEKTIVLENNKLKLTFSSKGAQLKQALLKNYKKSFGDSTVCLVNGDNANFYLQLRDKQRRALKTQDLMFEIMPSNDSHILWLRHSFTPSKYIDFIYTLSKDDYMLKCDVKVQGLENMLDRESAEMFEFFWTQKLARQEKSIKNEQRHARISYKYAGGEVKDLSESKNDSREASEAPIKWVAFKDQYFSSILIADNDFKTVQVDSHVLSSTDYLKDYAAKIYLQPNFSAKDNSLSTGFGFYLGPLDYSHLKSYDKNLKDNAQQLDLDKLVYLGWKIFRWVNQYFVIPVFNLLKSTGMSIGIIILLLTIIVKLIISPLTFKSFKSSAKMRVLKPQVDELNDKYPKQEQAMEKQQAVMALYRQAGVNPMAGCIPLLLQMPVLIALFQFFPSAIDLRQESFLWANDLSTYDAIYEWSANIPVLSWLFNNHISLFCILMTATNIIYTKFNMDMTNTGQQQMPGMKMMMYLMPLIFLFVLNDYPSGLTYYYFISLLITIILTLGFRYAVDEEKLLAQLEANKKKPKKKSGFMARLEEAQRMQQQQLRDKNNKGKRKK